MMEDEFYATLKLKTGEEIFCKVCASEEEERTLLLVSHPITCLLYTSPSPRDS